MPNCPLVQVEDKYIQLTQFRLSEQWWLRVAPPTLQESCSDRGGVCVVNAGRALALASALVLTSSILCITSGCVGISRTSTPTAPSVALDIVTSTLPPALVGQSYQFQVTAQGGTPPYSWSIASGTPAGMSLTSAGLLSGMARQIGTFNFTVAASDVAGGTVNKAFTLAVANMCGVNSDSTTLHLPALYGTLAMPGAGQANSMIDDQYGCQTWKVADMSVHDAGPTAIDSEDRWVITHAALTGNAGNWFEKSGWYIRDLFTGNIVCTSLMSGAGGFLWSPKAGDQDNLYFHVPGSKIYKLNVPGCIAGGGTALLTSAWVTLYDDLMASPGVELYDDMSWCFDDSDFSVDGDHLCVGNDGKGGVLLDPRRYTVSTKTVSPPMTGSPHQMSGQGCSVNTAYPICYRNGFIAPLSNNVIVAYEPSVSADGFHYLDLFNGTTGAYIETLNNYNSHGTEASWAGQDYIVDDVNGLDPAQPPDCNPGFQAIKLSDNTRTCLIDRATVGPNGGRDYQEPHVNGRATDGGNPYVAIDMIDYVYSYSAAYNFAALPRPGSATVLLTDAETAGDCTAGGGTHKAFCKWDGTYLRWEPISTASYPLHYDWSSNWGVYQNEIYLLYLDGSAPTHIVHHRSFSVEPSLGGVGTIGYWSSPRAVMSRSGRYMIWDSTWGGNNNISVYAARIK